MGCWNETCRLTNLPIQIGDEIIVFILRKNRNRDIGGSTHYDNQYMPICLPITAEYDDYGGFEKVREECNVLDDIKRYKYYMINKETIKRENVISSTDYSFQIEDTISRLYDYVEIEINSIEKFLEYLKDGLYVDITDQKYEITHWMCHKGACDTVLDSVKSRKFYNKDITLFEGKINIVKETLERLKTAIKRTKDKYPQYGDKFNDIFYLKMSCEYYTLSISQISGFDLTTQYLFDMILNKHEKYIDVVAEYICFVNALSLLRKGFYTQSGCGSQEYELILHEVLSNWILNFINQKRQEWSDESLDDDDDDDGDGFGSEAIW